MAHFTLIDPLAIRAEVAFGAHPEGNPFLWTWADVSADLKTIDGINGRFGRADEQGQAQAASVIATLDNDRGDYTPGRAGSPHWPNIRLNTPIRFTPILPEEVGNSFVLVEDSFDRTYPQQWGQPEIGFRWWFRTFGAVGTSGSMSVNGEYGILAKSGSGSRTCHATCPTLFENGDILVTVAAGQITTGTAVNARIGYRGDGLTNDGVTGVTQPFYRVELAFLSDGTIDLNWYYDDQSVSPAVMTLGAQVVGVQSYAAEEEFRVRIQVREAAHRIRVWPVSDPEPETWDIDAEHDGTGGGWVSGAIRLTMSTASGNTNTAAEIRWKDLLVESDLIPWMGTISEWSPEWPETDLSEEGVDLDDPNETRDPGYSRVRIVADGVLRRLVQGEKPLDSPMYRVTVRDDDVIAYWPMEDGLDATEFASPIHLTQPMQYYGEVDLALQGMSGSRPVPVFKPGSGFQVPVPPAAPGQWTVGCMFQLDEPVSGSFRSALHWTTSDPNFFRWRIRFHDTQYRVEVFNSGGSLQFQDDRSIDPEYAGRPIVIGVGAFTDSPSSVDYSRTLYDAITGRLLDLAISNRSTGQAGMVTGFNIGPMASSAPDGRSIAHVTVSSLWTADLAVVRQFFAMNGYNRERAGDRAKRIASEQGVPFTLLGEAELTERMGPQLPIPFTALLQQVEDLDGGILVENPWHPGLGYRARHTIEAQRTHVELDASPHRLATEGDPPDITNPFQPSLDDVFTRNDVTVNRVDGSSARSVDEEHSEHQGLYDEGVIVNAFHDNQLQTVADWRVHLGTWPGMRYRAITPAMNQNLLLVPPFTGLLEGDCIRVINLPPQHPDEDVELVLRGRSRRIAPLGWDEVANTSPCGPWLIGQLSGDGQGSDEIARRVDSSRSYLAEDIDGVADSIRVITPVTRPWNRVPDFEQEIIVGTTIPEPNPNDYVYFDADSFTRVRGQAFRGDWAGLLVPGVSGAPFQPRVVTFSQQNTVPDLLWSASAWLYAPNGSWPAIIQLQFVGDGTTTISSSQVVVPQGAWTRLYIEAVAPSPRYEVRGIVRGQLPSATLADVVFIDDFEVGIPGVPWADDTDFPSLFPFLIHVEPETMLVTAISQPDVERVQEFSVVRATSPFHDHVAGHSVRLDQAMFYSQGGGR